MKSRGLAVPQGWRIMPGAWRCAVAAGVEVIAMRRLGVIVALGVLLGMAGGVVTASPALARGPKWQIFPGAPGTLPAAYCGFGVGFAAVADKEFVVDESRNREDRHRERVGACENHREN
jgi:hypothetical protein